MEDVGNRKSPSTMTALFNKVTDVYRCVVSGSCPGQSPADTARIIISAVTDRNQEVSCIAVSLVGRMSSSVSSGRLAPHVASYCEAVLEELLEHTDLLLRQVNQFQSEDQIRSHVAAKTAAACVLYQLQTSGTVSGVWKEKCVQAFHRSQSGNELDACLWSLTEVLKKLIQGAHQVKVGRLVSALDSRLCALYSVLLPKESKEGVPCSVGCNCSRHQGTTMFLLLDLMEVLTASSLICGAGVCQRLTYIYSSPLLTTISCSPHSFVRKRALLLLKRAALQKLGEDWASGELLSTTVEHETRSSGLFTLAESVLTAVADNWLQNVHTEPGAFFGGKRDPWGAEGQRVDGVMLRAVSLILLKSINVGVQTAGEAGVRRVTEVHGCLQSLWDFLQRSGTQLTAVRHRCCWISLLFGEQDDDMMEAARALLSIFLSYKQQNSGLDGVSLLEAACASGFNPHCHFVFLLQSVSFDHSILLDFLISAETCFLEYFVHYLKYLRNDWPGFMAVCDHISASDCHLSGQRSAAESTVLTAEAQSLGVNSAGERCGGKAELRLVEYDGSDESDPEHTEGSEVTWRVEIGDPSSTMDRRAGCSSLPVVQSQHSCTDTTRELKQVTCEPLVRALQCLSELRVVVTRLHTKKLFPYNPSSLLKLLAHVGNCYSQVT
ncbi:protein Lines homolog 1 [Pholidichthys leucotaenia]